LTIFLSRPGKIRKRTVSRAPKMIAAVASLCAVSACAVSELRGPTVTALPKPGTSQAVFEQEHLQCRNYAAEMTYSARPGQGSLHTAIGGAALGTLLGAAAGTAIGGAARSAGAGAVIGSATGVVGGSAVAAKNARASELQKRYNIAYTQSMYALGDTVQAAPPARSGLSWLHE
jgi:uncharacterized protein YcfJ